jgi:hypothetical protein
MSSDKQGDRRLVFKTNGEARLSAICVRNSWGMVAQRLGDPERQIPLELEFASDEDDGDIRIVYVDDPISECSYVVVTGADKDKACKLITDKAETWSDEEALEAWRDAPHDSAQIEAILRVGVVAPHAYSERFAQVLKQALANEDRAVREAAVAAVAYRDWRELDASLQSIADGDSDERCRNRARLMLEVRQATRA